MTASPSKAAATPAAVVPPVVAPDLSQTTLDAAVGEITSAAQPFIPAKIRALIYSGGSLLAIVTVALAPVVGGTVGTILDQVGSACVTLTGALAVSHVTK